MTVVAAPQAITTPRDAPVPRPRMLRNSLTMGWRALLRTRHEPEQVADAIAIPVLFTLLFTYLFGGALAGSAHQYLRFLLPGTLVMTVLLITVSAGLSLNTDRAAGALDRFRSMPIWQPAVIVGGLLGDLGRYLLATLLVLGMGLLMGYRPAGGAGGAAAAVALALIFAFSISWIWTTPGLVMPGWLRAFVDANPVSHLVTTERALMNGTATAGQVGGVLLVATALIAVFGPLTMHLYRTRQ
jgi:daunorubicin/doxorubicin transport system permease protein